MITEKRLVLTTSDERILKKLSNFEGIDRIKSIDEVEKIWSYNKTPIASKKNRIKL